MKMSRLAWPGSVSLYFVARLAREHVKVVLTGEGSDETLGWIHAVWLDPLERAFRPCVPCAFARHASQRHPEGNFANGQAGSHGTPQTRAHLSGPRCQFLALTLLR